MYASPVHLSVDRLTFMYAVLNKAEQRAANNESSEVLDIIKPSQRVKIKVHMQ